MTKSLSFAFEGISIRVISNDVDHPEFVAIDVAKALGFKDPTNAIKQHCKGVVKRHPLQTEGGEQKVRVIQEPDLYRLIFGSTLESAQRFQDWVFEEVLPAIRKTGGYQIQQHSTDDVTWTYLGHMIILTMHGQHWVKMQSLANAMFYRGDIPSNFYKHAKGHDHLYVHCQDESEQVSNPRVSTQKQRAYYRYLPLSAVYNIANRDSRGLTAISQLNRHLASIGKQTAPQQPSKAPADHFAGLPAGRYLVVVENGEATLRDVSAYSIVSLEASEVLRRNMCLLERQFRAFRGEASEACMGTSLASLPECAV